MAIIKPFNMESNYEKQKKNNEEWHCSYIFANLFYVWFKWDKTGS